MKIAFYEQTHQGSRFNNQDYFIHVIEESWACFALTDGLGGHEKGEVASQEFCKAIHHLTALFFPKIMKNPILAVKELIIAAQARMQEVIHQEYGFLDTQTTFALVWVDPKQVIAAHIGDSRIYLLNPRQVLWRTLDHSYAQELLEKGKITANEFATHPSQCKLLKTLNLHERPSADVFVHPPLTPDQTMLLCSDGFWTSLKENDFIAIAQSQNIPEKIQDLIQQILIQRPQDADNITVQVIRLRN